MRVGFSGHQELPADARQLLSEAVQRLLGEHDALTVCCALAAGGDQLVAAAVLEGGGQLDAILPCRDYLSTFDEPAAKASFERLLGQSRDVTHLPFPGPSEEAFMAAGLVVVERCDLLLAAWDGEPAAGLGGTADVVAYARSRGRQVRIVWPSGTSR